MSPHVLLFAPSTALRLPPHALQPLSRRRRSRCAVQCTSAEEKPPAVSPAPAVSPSSGNGLPPSTQATALPPFHVHRAPHLTDYLPLLRDRPSPLIGARPHRTFARPGDVVLADIAFDERDPALHTRSFEAYLRAGPRERVFFPPGVRAAIVSCGGICPGINSVIRELTLCLFQYKADKVFGVQHGYRGFHQEHWTEIHPEDVELIHKTGGTMLGSSRGGFDLTKIVDAIETRGIDQVYVIGGDGTIMGCNKIYHEIRRRGLKTSVVSVPKTIDNDIAIIDRSFGFETAVDEAQRAINAAYVESKSFPDCISVVKLMGRNSGFIACHAALASREVDCCLVPEDPFVLDGPGGVLQYVEDTIDRKGSCVVVVAEGAGHDAMNNVDIGRHLLGEIIAYFKGKKREINTKYLDPTYQIRAIPTTTHDNVLCILMAHAAVHGAYAGHTGYSAGPVNGKNVYIPLEELSGVQKKMDTSESMWQRLRMSTGQPEWQLPDEFEI